MFAVEHTEWPHAIKWPGGGVFQVLINFLKHSFIALRLPHNKCTYGKCDTGDVCSGHSAAHLPQ